MREKGAYKKTCEKAHGQIEIRVLSDGRYPVAEPKEELERPEKHCNGEETNRKSRKDNV